MNRRRCRDDRGSVTVWTLGMVLVVLFLGAISFDLWSGFATRRDYAGAADQAAQAGANALDETLYRSTGQRKLDPARAEELASANLASQDLAGITDDRGRRHARPDRRRAHGNRRRGLAAHLWGRRPPRRPRPRRRTATRGQPMKRTSALLVSLIVLAAGCSGGDDASRHHKRLDQTGRHRHHNRPAVDDVCAGHDNGDHTATVDHVNHHD